MRATKQLKMSVVCPHCKVEFRALSPPSRLTPVAVHVNPLYIRGYFLARLLPIYQITHVSCPNSDRQERISLLWQYMRFGLPRLRFRKTQYTEVK